MLSRDSCYQEIKSSIGILVYQSDEGYIDRLGTKLAIHQKFHFQ